ncbi:hypothetical protein [Psychrobacter sp. BF1]|uniref:hypothetical protein n=1 Tax=Psychrobacter sp. BF1 TaxID=2821147 RepID=UPI001C4DDB67|nr:hypothetical protein [Psychrobacter sp. BF1]
MPKTPLALMIAASLLFATSACQPPPAKPASDKLEVANNSDKPKPSAAIQTIDETKTEPLVEVKTPKALTKAFVALSETKLTNELICTKLNDTMQQIDNKSKFEDIHTIQRQLEVCLPTTGNSEILQWLAEYQALYGRFLSINQPVNEQSFYTLMNLAERGEKFPLAALKKVTPRIRYLISLVESNADVNVLYLGKGDYTFHHDLKAMADLFTPYLPKDQSAFIQRLATDNQSVFWHDATIAVPFDQVLERAIFWQDYIQRYPNGYAIEDAKSLFAIYRYLLFFGSENTQWTDDELREFRDPAQQQAINQLAQSANSQLAQDAQGLIDFMALSASQRQKKYPAPSKNDNGDKLDKRQKAKYQLAAALQIASPWQSDHKSDYKNCFTGIVCVDSSTS